MLVEIGVIYKHRGWGDSTVEWMIKRLRRRRGKREGGGGEERERNRLDHLKLKWNFRSHVDIISVDFLVPLFCSIR